MGKDENQMKLFKCYDCGQQFYVSDEDSEDIVCRNCQSDNVSPVNRKPMLMKILAFVAIAAIGFGVALSVMKTNTTPPPPPPPIDTIPSLSDVLRIAKISYSDFTDNGNYTYSFIAKCEFENKEKTDFKYEYQLMETYDGNVIKTSTDGIFKDLKGTKSGSYFFKVIISDGKDKENTEPKEVTGCIIKEEEKPTPKPLPITPEVIASFKERLENDIKSQNASMGQNYISPSVKIVYTNLRGEDGDGPTNLQDIEDKLDVGKWKNVKVVDITLNKNKVIVSMTLEIEYP